MTAEHQQQVFECMKVVFASNCMLVCYPDHNLPFHIDTDTSDYQMGALIMLQNQLVAYYFPRKLNPAQRN